MNSPKLLIQVETRPRVIAITATEKEHGVFVRCINAYTAYATVATNTPTMCSVARNLDIAANPCSCDLCAQLRAVITAHKVAQELTK